MVLLSVFLCVSLAGALPLGDEQSECGKEASELPLHRDPWLVYLEYGLRAHGRPPPPAPPAPPAPPPTPRCAGTLVHARHALTAAHCLTSVRFTRLSVRLGEYDLSGSPDCVEQAGRRRRGRLCAPPPLSVPVAEAVLPAAHAAHAAHDADAGAMMSHDLALLRLQHRVPTTNFVRPVCLPETGIHLRTTTLLHATGWGELIDAGYSSQYADIKKNVTLPLWDIADCRKIYKTQMLPQAIICAGGESADTCKGDSGGPLTVRMGLESRVVLVGITSAGYPRCGTAGFPGLYTRIVDYLPWIKRILARTLSPASSSAAPVEFSSILALTYMS